MHKRFLAFLDRVVRKMDAPGESDPSWGPDVVTHDVDLVQLPPLVQKAQVDEVLAEASMGIQAFLTRLEGAILARELELVPTTKKDVRMLSGNFEGHTVLVRTICASPLLTFGLDLEVLIDDVPIHRSIASRFTENMLKVLKSTMSDTNALADAKRLRDLSRLLQQTRASKTIS